MSKKCCMVVHHYFPRDVRVRREARALAQAGWDVSVVCLKRDGEPSREHFRGIDIRRQGVSRHRGSPLPVYLAEYAVMTARSTAAMIGLVAAGKFDVVHVHTPPDFLVLSALPAMAAGAKLVLDIHDLSPELYSQRFGTVGGSLARLMLQGAERGACSLATRVITVTEVFKDRLVERGVPSGKISVIRNCPDEEIFVPPARRRASPGQGFKVVHHGTLVRRYGLEVLLDAFANLAEVVPHATLDIFGEGDLEPVLRSKAESAGLSGRVTFHGDVLQDELTDFLAEAHLCVVPNLNDGFTDMLLPTKLLEALRMGCPTVASKTSMIARVLNDDEVCMVAPGDVDALAGAMIRLASDPDLRRELGDRGKKASERFSWAREKYKLTDLYDSLLH